VSVSIHNASAEEADRLWAAVRADRLFRGLEAFRAYRDAHPWCVRVAHRGEAALLGRWKSHLDVLAIRGLWASDRNVGAFIEDAFVQAREHGFGRVLSPLLPEGLLGPYLSAGMTIAQRVVAIQGRPELVLSAGSPVDVVVREGSSADIPAVAQVDAASFDGLWEWNEQDLREFLANERLAVAESKDGTVLGYTLANVNKGAATLTRLAVVPQARGCGIGGALLGEAATWAASCGAVTVALCTQIENSASRSLYAAAGLTELKERYAFAIGDVEMGARS
jgi:[ribosomal protein S18]-alanine N-acetyltransferase